ncbi:DPP IV N-terminal domain-containing protein, partial [Flavobacteriaceae bacterium]|nr:DPP IV N-terminal domain-containing protein [Flavobacteriaceae bacterium]
MKKIIFLFFFINLIFGQPPTISLNDLWNGNYNPVRLESVRSMKNGTSYTVLETTSQKATTTVMQYDFNKVNSGTIIVSSDNLPEITSFSNYSFSKNEEKIILETEVNSIYRRSKEAIYWTYNKKNKELHKISDNKIQEPLFSPDATKIAYVFERNLFIKDLVSQKKVQVTFDGDYKTLNGISDWVYEEEFGFVRAFDWSPDSSALVYMRFDETKVPIFSMDIYGKDVYQFPYRFRYPKA